MTPLEALGEAMVLATLDRGRRYPRRPGAVVERLTEEGREALSRLTSKELGTMRWFDGNEPDPGSVLRRNFDRLLLRR